MKEALLTSSLHPSLLWKVVEQECFLRYSTSMNATRFYLPNILQLNSHRNDIRAVSRPSMPLDFSLSASRLQYERSCFYATHWEKYCLPALSPIFEELTPPMDACPVLGDATLSISACNLSRARPELKKPDTLRDEGLVYRPI